MVLFYCTFVALKARNLLTVQVHPSEFHLRREKRLFQAYVIYLVMAFDMLRSTGVHEIWLTLCRLVKSSMTVTGTHSLFTRTYRHGDCGYMLQCGRVN
jgi:hypothetical protein